MDRYEAERLLEGKPEGNLNYPVAQAKANFVCSIRYIFAARFRPRGISVLRIIP